MRTVVTWYDHSAFKLSYGDANVLIDPFFAPDCGVTWKDVGKVDTVLITHDHYDHVGDAVEICKATGAKLGAVVETAAVMVKRGVPKDQILNGVGFNIGGSMNCNGIEVTMVQAFHSSNSGVPVGYIVRMPDNVKIYHAGDTGIFDSMELLAYLYGIDLALLPIGGVFTMDAMQAAHACRLLRCRKVIPMHWGTFPALAQTTAPFQAMLTDIAPECVFVGMKHGESVEI